MTIQELIKERDKIAFQYFFRKNNTDAFDKAINDANELMCVLYGKDWKCSTTPENKSNTATIIGPNTATIDIPDKYGYNITIVDYNNEKWVRVQALGEDFIIAPHDLIDQNGNIMINRKPSELMERLRELKLNTFNRKQGFIIATLIVEINTKLKEAGGDKFAKDSYISNELWKVADSAVYNNHYLWFLHGNYGYFSYDNRYYYNFRSRPIMNYKN